MSWNELERLVETAERDGGLRRALRHCRSRAELVMAARRLQFQISLEDLQRARLLHGREASGTAEHDSWHAEVPQPLEA